MPDVYDVIEKDDEPICPECKEEPMEYIDPGPEEKDFWHCNYCGHEEPV